MTESPEERRKTPRVPVAARVKFKDQDREEVWFTEDVSEGGLFLRAETPPFVGTVLEMEISVMNVPDLLRLKGDVVWRQDRKGCGVRFLRVTAKQKKVLQTFIAQAQEK